MPEKTELEQRVDDLNQELEQIFVPGRAHDLLMRREENWFTTLLAVTGTKLLAETRGEEFAEIVHVPHEPRLYSADPLVSHRRQGKLRFTYTYGRFVPTWWHVHKNLPPPPEYGDDEGAELMSYIEFADVVAFEQTVASRAWNNRLLFPNGDMFRKCWRRLHECRTGECYGGFCWEILYSELIPLVERELVSPLKEQLAGRLHHWVVRLGNYKSEIVGTAIEFPLAEQPHNTHPTPD